jgi:hypothetical protein|tara:strand:- start:547 stop:831 length:285 start_codon:yes stop_codon:yes gene_type:complete
MVRVGEMCPMSHDQRLTSRVVRIRIVGMETAPKYDVEVQLTGEDGNAFAILAAVIRGLRKAGASAVEIDDFRKEAMSGDYDALLRTAMRWVNVN